MIATVSAKSSMLCRTCHKLLAVPVGRHGSLRCPRCGSGVSRRKTNSIERSWALLIAAVVLYVPANVYPVMKIEIECPGQFQGTVVGNLAARRGTVTATELLGPIARIEGEVPLAETFGYSTHLRSLTQGQGTFTMEFTRYKRLPASLAEEVIAASKKTALAGAF